ncbi:MAG: group 1 truncated hemoglobin [Sphingopyxis sp.]|uniref:group I truncated hemoglobin n=1 Tax=Sphingopyxis sp. TaxID=1908224 RepID=UPI003D810BBF
MLLFAAALLMQPVTEAPVTEAPVVDAPVDWDKEFGVEEKVRDPATGELPVDPYVQDNRNAGAAPFVGPKMAAAFGGQDGIRRIAARTVELSEADPRIAEIFKAHDMVRLKRTLFEQFCYILGAGCDYSGRDMAASHKDMGVRMRDMNALVENLQRAMREEKVPFAAQNRFLAKLAPMSGDVITR